MKDEPLYARSALFRKNFTPRATAQGPEANCSLLPPSFNRTEAEKSPPIPPSVAALADPINIEQNPFPKRSTLVSCYASATLGSLKSTLRRAKKLAALFARISSFH